MDSKVWYKSTTIWVGLIQATAGLLTALATFIESGWHVTSFTAFIIGAKGAYDIWLRTQVTHTVTLTSTTPTV